MRHEIIMIDDKHERFLECQYFFFVYDQHDDRMENQLFNLTRTWSKDE